MKKYVIAIDSMNEEVLELNQSMLFLSNLTT